MGMTVSARKLNHIVATLDETQDAVDTAARQLESRAKMNLAWARLTTPHTKMSGPDRLTKIRRFENAPGKYGDIDQLVVLEAPNPIAIEYGHSPSGKFGGTDTKSPSGLYILNRAAFIDGSNVVSNRSGRGSARRKKKGRDYEGPTTQYRRRRKKKSKKKR